MQDKVCVQLGKMLLAHQLVYCAALEGGERNSSPRSVKGTCSCRRSVHVREGVRCSACRAATCVPVHPAVAPVLLQPTHDARNRLQVTQQAITRIQSLTTQLGASAASRVTLAHELEQVHARLLDAHAKLEAEQAAASAAADAASAQAAQELASKEADLALRSTELKSLQASLADSESSAAQSRQLHADLLDTRAQQVASYEKALQVRQEMLLLMLFNLLADADH